MPDRRWVASQLLRLVVLALASVLALGVLVLWLGAFSDGANVGGAVVVVGGVGLIAGAVWILWGTRPERDEAPWRYRQ